MRFISTKTFFLKSIPLEALPLLAENHALSPSFKLWLLALITSLLLVGKTSFLSLFWLIFAQAYTSPDTNPIPMALTLPNVTGASKNTNPDKAIGSLLRAPTIEYVVDEVTRTHHAEV